MTMRYPQAMLACLNHRTENVNQLRQQCLFTAEHYFKQWYKFPDFQLQYILMYSLTDTYMREHQQLEPP
jgi:hypothetical protein